MNNKKYPVADGARHILDTLRDAGFEAYIVGGAVRDMLLGSTPSDYDITTSAMPEQTKAAFSEEKTIDTGIKHGTVTVLYGGVPYEVTTYRTEGGYRDNRHPDSVCFVSSLDDDLSRRDFTVNAMCINAEGELYDAFGGAEDLKNGIIRTVGEAKRRFTEDALRILRALRFCAVLDFKIEERTAAALHGTKELLKNVSGERIFAELIKLLSGKGAYRVLTEYSEIITAALPSLSGVSIENPERFAALTPREKLIALHISAPNGSLEAAINRLCDTLHTDRELRDCALSAGRIIKLNPKSERQVLHILKGRDGEYITSALAIGYSLGYRADDGKELLEAVKASGVPYKISELALGGGDLLSLGFKGEAVGKILSAALDLIINGELENDREILLKYAKMQTNNYKSKEIGHKNGI